MLCFALYILCSPRATLNIVPLINIIAKLACPNPAEGAKQIEKRKPIRDTSSQRDTSYWKKLYKIIS